MLYNFENNFITRMELYYIMKIILQITFLHYLKRKKFMQTAIKYILLEFRLFLKKHHNS